MRLSATYTGRLANEVLTDPVISFAGMADGDALIASGGQCVAQHAEKYCLGDDGAATDSGAIQLLRSYYHTTLTLTGACALDANSCPIFINDTFDITTAPTAALITHVRPTGNNAAVNVAGAALILKNGPTLGANILGSGTAGAGGATNAGTANTASNVVSSINGGGPGTAGTAGTGLAGVNAGGTPTNTNITTAAPIREVPRWGLCEGFNGGVFGAGGPSGGGDATATASGAGGGGGSGAYALSLWARKVNRSSSNANAGVIQLLAGHGGNGGTPAAGNRGAGGPGNPGGGGLCHIRCEELLGTAHTNCVDVSGGNGGNAGAPTGTGGVGTGSTASFGGRLIVDVAGVCTVTDKTAVGGNAGSGVTGGVATTAQCNL